MHNNAWFISNSHHSVNYWKYHQMDFLLTAAFGGVFSFWLGLIPGFGWAVAAKQGTPPKVAVSKSPILTTSVIAKYYQSSNLQQLFSIFWQFLEK